MAMKLTYEQESAILKLGSPGCEGAVIRQDVIDSLMRLGILRLSLTYEGAKVYDSLLQEAA